MPSKLARRRRKRLKSNPSPRHNPPLFTDMLGYAMPGLGGFALTRLLTKLAMIAIGKKWPGASKHVGAAVSLGSFLSSWYLGHKVKFLAPHHTAITAGAGIATATNLLQIYMPKAGWLIGDPTEATAGGTASSKVAASAQLPQLPPHLEELDEDPSLFTYDDKYDAGRYAPQNQTTPPLTAAAQQPLEEETWGGGVFAGGFGN